MRNDKIELAKLYVQRSNDHDVERIRPLLHTGVTYGSSNVGVHSERAPVLAMMAGFFKDYPDVTWETENYALNEQGSVTFDFSLSATHRETNELLRRHGVERIDFDGEHLITHIEVDSRA